MSFKKTILIVLLFLSVRGFSQEVSDTVSVNKDTLVTKLIVGYKIIPPFVMEENGCLSGVSIDLWETIAEELGCVFEYRKYKQSEMQKLLSDVEAGKINISINPTTVTSERIEKVDFSQPFYMSSLAVAVPLVESNQITGLISNIFSWNFLTAVFVLIVILLIFGIFIWLIENKVNRQQFRHGIKGIGDGVWWAATTMTTVGYGDLSPKSFVGRLFGIIWMFTAIIVISGLTGSIAASLTTHQIKSTVNSVSDLNNLSVGTIKGTSSEEFLLRNNIHNFNNNFETVEQAMDALADGKIDAFVYDEPLLRYYISANEKYENLTVIDKRFSVDYISFSMKKNDKLLPEINKALISELEKISWLGVLHKYQLAK